jgi:magnesium chelatase subunit D
MTDFPDPALIAALLALDGQAFGGVHIRGPSGPQRDAFLTLLQDLIGQDTPLRRCPISIDEERLLGGLDLTASLASGSSVMQKGLLAEADGGYVAFAMAECLSTNLGAQVGGVLDRGEVAIARDGIEAKMPARLSVILLDEGVSEEERAPDALTERCAFAFQSADLRILLELQKRAWPTFSPALRML